MVGLVELITTIDCTLMEVHGEEGEGSGNEVDGGKKGSRKWERLDLLCCSAARMGNFEKSPGRRP